LHVVALVLYENENWGLSVMLLKGSKGKSGFVFYYALKRVKWSTLLFIFSKKV